MTDIKKIIYSSEAPRPIGPYSQAVESGKFLYVSGQIPIDPRTNEVVKGDISIQTERVLRNIDAILKTAEYSFKNVVFVMVYLSDINDYSSFNKIYSKYFTENYPARVVVEASNLPKNAVIEMALIAYKE